MSQKLFNLFKLLAAVIAASSLLAPIRVQALDYTPISLECMLASADAIVVAQLPARAENSNYFLQVTTILRGNALVPGTLQVEEPAPWRGTKPSFTSKEGLIFLQHTKTGQWKISGPSGEGRVPLEEQHVDLTAISLPLAKADNRYSRDLLLNALEMASYCFSFQRGEKAIIPINRCSVPEQKLIMTRSALHRSLFERLNSAAENNGLNCALLGIDAK